MSRPELRHAAHLATLLLASTLLICSAPAGATRREVWTLQRLPVGGSPHADFQSVTCPTSVYCFAVGYTYRYDSSVTHPLAVTWDGSHWSDQTVPAKPVNAQLNAVGCSSATACTAVGYATNRDGQTYPIAVRWNGFAWSYQKVPAPRSYGSADQASLWGVACPGVHRCIAVGSDDDAGSALAELWNGRRWSIQRIRDPNQDQMQLLDISCGSRSDCVAGGTITPQACAAPLLERWNGSVWRMLVAARLPHFDPVNDVCGPPGDGVLGGIACLAGGGCTAVGYYSPSNSIFDKVLAERLKRGVWDRQPTPSLTYRIDPWGGDAFYSAVACLHAGTCFAVGAAGSAMRFLPIVSRWNGRRWIGRTVAAGSTDGGGLVSVACQGPASCFAVGATSDDEPLVLRMT